MHLFPSSTLRNTYSDRLPYLPGGLLGSFCGKLRSSAVRLTPGWTVQTEYMMLCITTSDSPCHGCVQKKGGAEALYKRLWGGKGVAVMLITERGVAVMLTLFTLHTLQHVPFVL